MNRLKIKSHAVFVDGENFSIRLGNIINTQQDDFTYPIVYDSFRKEMFWHQTYSGYFSNIPNSELLRIYYYGSMKNGELGNEIETHRLALQKIGIGETFAIAKGKSKQTKTVDIKLTTDLLSLAASGRVDEIYLVAMDADYIPVIEKAKSYGVKMTLAFPGFDLIQINAVLNIKELKKTMGVPKSEDYLLSFDRIDPKINWINIKNILSDENKKIVKIMIEVLRDALPQKQFEIIEENETIILLAKDNGNPKIFIKSDVNINISFKRESDTYNVSTGLRIFPRSNFETRLIELINQFKNEWI